MDNNFIITKIYKERCHNNVGRIIYPDGLPQIFKFPHYLRASQLARWHRYAWHQLCAFLWQPDQEIIRPYTMCIINSDYGIKERVFVISKYVPLHNKPCTRIEISDNTKYNYSFEVFNMKGDDFLSAKVITLFSVINFSVDSRPTSHRQKCVNYVKWITDRFSRYGDVLLVKPFYNIKNKKELKPKFIVFKGPNKKLCFYGGPVVFQLKPDPDEASNFLTRLVSGVGHGRAFGFGALLPVIVDGSVLPYIDDSFKESIMHSLYR